MKSFDELRPEFERWKTRYPAGTESSLVLPCLRRLQEERGYVADADIAALVDYLGVPRIQVEEVLSFYTQLRRAPIGKTHVQVCRNVSCSMRGSERLLARLRERLGIVPGETSADGSVTVSTVECLGSCGTAPVVVVGETYHESMSPARLDALLDQLNAANTEPAK